MAKRHWLRNGNIACPTKATSDARLYGITAERFVARSKADPDLFCTLCAKAARLALAKESAPEVVVYQEPRPVYTPGQSTGFGPVVSVRPLVTHDPSKCAQKPIAPATESAPKQSDIVITQNWLGPDKPEGARTSAPRYRAGQAAIGSTWPKPRPIEEYTGNDPFLGLCKHHGWLTVRPERSKSGNRLHGWLTCGPSAAYVIPTHFLPLPPKVKE